MSESKFIILFIILIFNHLQTCFNRSTANLTVITYSPLNFNLSFSKPIPLPPFQLMFNDIPIVYSVQNSNSVSQYYIINGLTEGIVNPSDFITEKYVLMFSQPFEIDQGNLTLSSFLLRANRSRQEVKYVIQSITEKSSHFKYQYFSYELNVLALVICAITYFLAYTTVVGLTTYSLLVFYVYLSLQSAYFTALDYKIAFYLLFDVNQVDGDGYAKLFYTLIPHFLLLFSFIVGLISRFFLEGLSKKKGISRYIYYFLSYKFLIITWQIVFVPIFANTVQYFRYFTLKTTTVGTIISSVYIYYSIITMLLYVYLSYFTANPQIGQSQEKWAQYTKSDHYMHFEGFHFGVNPNGCRTRSFKFVIAIFRIVFLICIAFPNGLLVSIFLQIAFLIYIFVFRPLKYDFFNLGNFAVQTLVILLYIFRYLSQKFIKISQDIATSTEVSRILLTYIILFCIVIFLYTLMSIFQLVNRIRMMVINLRQINYKAKDQDKLSKTRKHKNSLFKRQEDTIYNLKERQNQRNKIKQYIPPQKVQSKLQEKQEQPKNNKKKKNKNRIQEKLKRQPAQKQRELSEHSSRSVSSSLSNSQKRQKWNKKLKQKSNLLQSISLDLNNTPQ